MVVVDGWAGGLVVGVVRPCGELVGAVGRAWALTLAFLMISATDYDAVSIICAVMFRRRDKPCEFLRAVILSSRTWIFSRLGTYVQ